MDLDYLDSLAVTMADSSVELRLAALVEDYAAFYGMSPEVAREELLARLDGAPSRG